MAQHVYKNIIKYKNGVLCNMKNEYNNNMTNTIFNDCSYFSGIFTPKNQYISGEYDLKYLQNIKEKLDGLKLYSTIKILKSCNKLGKLLLIVKGEV